MSPLWLLQSGFQGNRPQRQCHLYPQDPASPAFIPGTDGCHTNPRSTGFQDWSAGPSATLSPAEMTAHDMTAVLGWTPTYCLNNTNDENSDSGLSSDSTAHLRCLQSFAETTGNEGKSLRGQGQCTKLTWKAIQYHVIVIDVLNRKKSERQKMVDGWTDGETDR